MKLYGSIIAALCALLLTACTTEEAVTEQPAANPIEVTFNVKALDVSTEPMAAPSHKAAPSTRASVEAGQSSLNELRWWIYDEAQYKKYTGTQTKADAGANFGKVKLTLPPGERYFILFWGFNGLNADGTFELTDGSSSSGIGDTRFYYFDKDVFYTHINNGYTQITAEQKEIPVTLPRLSGQLVLNLTDTQLPEGITSVEGKLYYYYGYSVVENKAESYISVPQTFKVNFEEGKAIPIRYYLMPDGNLSTKLVLTAYNGSTEVGQVEVKTPIYANRRTVVTGNLADVFSGREFTITVDEQWGEDNNVTLQ